MSTIHSMRRTFAGWTSPAGVLCGFPIAGRPVLSFRLPDSRSQRANSKLPGIGAVNRSSLPLSFQSHFVEVWT